MTPKYKKAFSILLILCIVSFAVQICFLPSMPDQIPIHWNLAGEIDGYGSKWLVLFLAALPAAMVGLMRLLPRIDPRRDSYEKHMDVHVIASVLIALFMLIISWIVILSAENVVVPVERILPAMLGVLFFVLGNYMPRIRHNYTFGIRTSWTLASETVWKKTHRMGGFCFMALGAVMILHAVIQTAWLAVLSVSLLLGSVIFLTVYSWYLWKKEQENG